MLTHRPRYSKKHAVLGAFVACLAVAVPSGTSAAGPGIDGWTQTGALVNHNSGLEWDIQLVEHASVVDDAGTTYALGGSIWYSQEDYGWTNYSVFRSPSWTFENNDIHLTLSPNSIHAFNYGGYLWFLGRDIDGPSFGLCLFRASVPYTQMQRIGCVQPYRSGYGAVVANGYLYIVGGSGTSQVQFTKLNTDGTIGPWTATTGPPATSYGHATSVAGRIYAIGVGTVIGSPDRNRVQSAPINTNGSLGAWREETNRPPAQGPAVSIGNDIYIVGPEGGTGHTYYTTAGANGVLDPWQTSAYILPVTSQHSVAVKGKKLVVIGGLKPGSGTRNQRASNAVLETTTTSDFSNSELLARYSPHMRYANGETYMADSAATITDNCVWDASINKPVTTNYLNDSRGRHLAASCPQIKGPDLSLGYLGSYGGVNTDRIDEDNDQWIDAQRMHGEARYRDKIYGRVVDLGPQGKILQYWLWYYNNPTGFLGIGAHEGDWEMIQLHIGTDQVPFRATYAQHKVGETCSWDRVERTSTDRPIVYVGLASHASYFRPGPDGSDDLGLRATPTAEDVTSPPTWLGWTGRWGGSDNSPNGPGNGDNSQKWQDPLGWSNSASIAACTVVTAQAGARHGSRRSARHAPVTGPAPPELSARRVGSRVVFRYQFDGTPRTWAEPRYLVTSADASGTRYPPLTKFTRIRQQTGLVRQRVGLGHGPFRFYASVITADGRRGVTVPARARR
jgi:hypothetical protein